MKNKFRIVTDRYLGYEVQIKYWWFPVFWFQKWKNGPTNTFISIDDAKEWINKKCIGFKSKTVWP